MTRVESGVTIPKGLFTLYSRYLERMVCQLIPATMQLRDPKTNARCDISGTVTELSNVKWNDKKVKQNDIF
jgi:hypothetical protein